LVQAISAATPRAAPMGRQPRTPAFQGLMVGDEPKSSPTFGCRSSPMGRVALAATPSKQTPSILANALSGAVSSVLAEVVLFPIVKLLKQTARPGETNGFFAVIFRRVQEIGLEGLYQGLGTSVIKESVNAINCGTWHGMLFRYLAKDGDTSSTPASRRFLINLLAKQLTWLGNVPFDVISSVNQSIPGSPGFIVTVLTLYKQGGVANFYRGLVMSLFLTTNPAIMNTLIASFLRLATMIKTAAGMDYEDARDHGPATVGTVTAISKTLVTLATYPLFRAKVVQQTSNLHKDMSPIAIWRDILAKEGPGGLYRGALAQSFKTVFWNALMMRIKKSVGPKLTLTPPPSPARRPLQIPAMGQDPCNDLAASEKLDELLEYIHESPRDPIDYRVGALENRLERVSAEIQGIKGPPQHLAASLRYRSNSQSCDARSHAEPVERSARPCSVCLAACIGGA